MYKRSKFSDISFMYNAKYAAYTSITQDEQIIVIPFNLLDTDDRIVSRIEAGYIAIGLDELHYVAFLEASEYDEGLGMRKTVDFNTYIIYKKSQIVGISVYCSDDKDFGLHYIVKIVMKHEDVYITYDNRTDAQTAAANLYDFAFQHAL